MSRLSVLIPLSKIVVLPELSLRDDPSCDLDELAHSLQEHDLLEAIVVADRLVPGSYVLLAGERRYWAAHTLGWYEIAATVRSDVTTLADAVVLGLTENVERQGLSDLEAGRAGLRLMGMIERGEITVPASVSDEHYRTDDYIAALIGMGRMKWRMLYATLTATGAEPDLAHVEAGLQDGSLSAPAALREVLSYRAATQEVPLPTYKPDAGPGVDTLGDVLNRAVREVRVMLDTIAGEGWPDDVNLEFVHADKHYELYMEMRGS